MIEALIDVVLLTFLVSVVIAIIYMKDLVAVVMLTGIYGLLTASFFVTMDAVDVAFTEASVGAGISTLLLLVAISKTKRSEHRTRHKPLLALILVTITGGLLIYGTFDMPYFGSADSPAAQSDVTSRFIEDSYAEIGIPNMVTSVLASYRGFDTFGEVVVIFTAGIGILGLLSVSPGSSRRKKAVAINESMHEQQLVLRIVAKILIPFILIFALYVQFHGEYSPGGGFQAGVIFAAGIILYSMIFGLDIARRVINQTFIRLIAAIGVLLYGSVGMVSFLAGGNFLDYNVLLENPIAGQHLGIILIELGVGFTVTAVMIIIYFNFAGRNEVEPGKIESGE